LWNVLVAAASRRSTRPARTLGLSSPPPSALLTGALSSAQLGPDWTRDVMLGRRPGNPADVVRRQPTRLANMKIAGSVRGRRMKGGQHPRDRREGAATSRDRRRNASAVAVASSAGFAATTCPTTKRSAASKPVSSGMGHVAAHTEVTFQQQFDCEYGFAPGSAELTTDSPAPLRAAADGRYPGPQPRRWGGRERSASVPVPAPVRTGRRAAVHGRPTRHGAAAFRGGRGAMAEAAPWLRDRKTAGPPPARRLCRGATRRLHPVRHPPAPTAAGPAPCARSPLDGRRRP
jgi:hypothetical protein